MTRKSNYTIRDYIEGHSHETLMLLDAINNDTGDWLSGECKESANDVIQEIHNYIGEFFDSA